MQVKAASSISGDKEAINLRVGDRLPEKGSSHCVCGSLFAELIRKAKVHCCPVITVMCRIERTTFVLYFCPFLTNVTDVATTNRVEYRGSVCNIKTILDVIIIN